MEEVTAMETIGMLQKCVREIAWGPLLDLEKRRSTNHWLEDSKLIVEFDAINDPETVREYLSEIYDQQIKS